VNVHELQRTLQSLNGGWVDAGQTVDTLIAGDGASPITGIAVGWLSYTWALQRAVELNCNVFITHEPTYYQHHDRMDGSFRQAGQDKQAFIQARRLAVLRCHDLWDQYPGIGIPDSWGALLGLGEAVDSQTYFRVYNVGGIPAEEVARQVAERTARFGQPGVQLIGPPEKRVFRVGSGTGAITPLSVLVQQFGVDMAICTDDGLVYWRDAAYAIDWGIPVVVVNHAVSEEAGLINLAAHLKSRFPEIPVHHIPQQCMYRLVGGVD